MEKGSAGTTGAASSGKEEKHDAMGNGGSSATSGAANKDEMKKGEEGKSSTMKNESSKSTSGKAEGGKTDASKNAEQNKSSTSGAGSTNAEGTKNGANTPNATSGAAMQQGTTGKAGNAPSTGSASSSGGGNVNLTTQQKTEIKNTVINSKSAPRVTSVNFNVSVGTVVPTTVHFAPVPETLVRIHPGWRGYDYFVYEDQVIIIEPHSHKIVEIIVVS